METKKYEALIEVSENGNVKVSSGLPMNEPVIMWPLEKRRGVMSPMVNGDLSFVADVPCGVLPPQVDTVYREGNVTVKRSSRNYIVTMKVPVIEAAEVTKKRFAKMMKEVSGAIRENRESIKEIM